MNIGYDLKAYSVILAQDSRVLDRCMNEGSSLDLKKKKKKKKKKKEQFTFSFHPNMFPGFLLDFLFFPLN